MLLIPRAVRVYVATYPMNLHRSFEGLSNEVRCVLARDPLAGHIFVFLNRRKTMVKLLVWTRGGFTILHKKLERGTFSFPQRVTADVRSVELDVHELSMLLEGIDLSTGRASKRWEPAARTPKPPQPDGEGAHPQP